MEYGEFSILPYVTFLISTHNRREVLRHTLRQLREVERQCELMTETIVVDNASTDGTAEAVAREFPQVLLLRQQTNRGACAKNAGLAHAAGRYILFLDDDSYPVADSLQRMVEHFAADPKLGAAVFDVILPNGSHESSAYPRVFIGCGTGFRREALQEAGGLPEDFFMQAEEYDLSFRLLDCGWDIRRIQGLQVIHLKTTAARNPARTTRLDTRNNLSLITRYFPHQWVLPFAVDWMRRYRWIAKQKGWRHELAFWRGMAEGIARSLRRGHRRPVSLSVFERFSMAREIRVRMERALRESGYRSIVLIDVGKNLLPFMMAARECGAKVVAIADAKLSARRRKYRETPVLNDAAAMRLEFDAAIVANISPVESVKRREQWRRFSPEPVIDLFEQKKLVELVARVA